MRRSIKLLLLCLATAMVAVACSFTLGNFKECSKSAECASHGVASVCSPEGFCVKPPEAASDAGVPDTGAVALADGGGVPDAGTDPMEERCQRAVGSTSADAVVLGLILPFTKVTGDVDSRGVNRLNGVKMAVDEMNSYQGINGRKQLRVVACDNSATPDISRAAARFLIGKYKIPAMITPGSADTLAIAAETISAGVLIISNSATSPDITNIPDKQSPADIAGLVWRVAPSDAIQGKVIADILAAEPTGAPARVAVLYVDEPYGQGLSAVFKERYSLTSPAATTTLLLYVKGADLTSALDQAEAFNPKVTLFIGFPADVTPALSTIAAQTPARPNLLASKWFFTDSTKGPETFDKVVGSKAFLDGSRGTAPATPSGSAYDSFRSRYQQKFGVDPATVSFTAQSYDATYLLSLAASWAATSAGDKPITGVRMAAGLTHMSSGTVFSFEPTQYSNARTAIERGDDINVKGASGDLDFDNATGEAPSAIELWQWREADGGVQHVKDFAPPKDLVDGGAAPDAGTPDA